MAVRPGEENVATLFGDIHYFYSAPTAKPLHHRFDKGSYVYLFENASERRARVEIANQPGTDDQDAFDGFLDHTRVQYSYKQQCLVSITVDGVPGAPGDQSQWHLPTYDPHNQAKYHYKLRSLDIYFWTQSDALQFVNGVRRLLPPAQVQVSDEPGPPAHMPPPQALDANPLVQKLENMAISDPRYATSKPAAAQGAIPSFAPPPTAPTPSSAGSSQTPQTFAPMAYNPAAPAAPEQITHREKTPPPEDDGHDPLAAAVARDNGVHPQSQAYGGGYGGQNFSAPPGQPGLPGPPPPPPGVASPGFAPPQFGQLQRSSTMPISGMASPGLQSPYGNNFPGSPGFAPGQQQQQQQAQATPPPPPPSAAAPPQQVQSPSLPPPPGGFTQYNYSQRQHAPPQGQQSLQGQQQNYGPTGGDWNIHQQVYRPTEAEYNNKYKEDKYQPDPRHDDKPSKLGQNAERLEKGVTGMLKKFEKRFG